MHLRLKTSIIAPDGKRKFLGLYWTPERAAAALAKAGVSAGWQVEIELLDCGKIPDQCKPGSKRATMNGKPIKRAVKK